MSEVVGKERNRIWDVDARIMGEEGRNGWAMG
jgi:hypothetical protein